MSDRDRNPDTERSGEGITDSKDKDVIRGPFGGGRHGPHGHHGPGRVMMPAEKAKDLKGTVIRLIRYIGEYRNSVLIVIMLAAGSTVFSIAGPKILSGAITGIADGIKAKTAGFGGIDFSMVARTLTLLLGIYVLSALLNFAQGWIMNGVTQNVLYKMRRDISRKIGKIPMKYFESRTVGEVLSRITNDVDTVGNNLNMAVSQIITSVCMIFGTLLMMLSISPLMTLISVVLLPVSGVLIGTVMKFSQKHFITQQKYLGKLNGQIEETISGHNVVKLFGYEPVAINEFNKTNNIMFESAWKSQFFSGLMMPLMNFVGNLGYVGVAIAGGLLAFRGSIALGDIQAFIQYIRSFTHPIAQAAQISNMFQSMAAAMERVFELLDEEEEVTAADIPAPTVSYDIGSITFDHVRFGYNQSATVISDFSCDVKPGQTVAIVGPTGAGKTTVIKLLMRFYDVNEGSILHAGLDIRETDRAIHRENLAMVLQDTWLFKGSIMENIRYGRQDASDEEVYAAASAAYAHRFIKTLPGGYDMELNEDATNISQGQKQLLTIARAILANRPILILDEATSSVDTRTEVLIQSAMRNLMRGRTSFVIAHRLSTIRDADLILVLRGGDIVEQGTHTELLEKHGFYAELYESQFETASRAA